MIITVGRQHGSNGHDIARLLARELNMKCYDKEIVDEAAANSHFSKEIFDSYDEKRVSAYIIPTPHYVGMQEGFRLNMQVAAAQFEAMRNIADKGNCVFVGRCADYVLRNRKDVVSVFIMSDMAFRVKTIMARKGLTEEQAKKLIREVDKDRAASTNIIPTRSGANRKTTTYVSTAAASAYKGQWTSSRPIWLL